MAGRGTDIALADGIAARGGLHVIMSERHEAGRIDRSPENGAIQAIHVDRICLHRRVQTLRAARQELQLAHEANVGRGPKSANDARGI